MAATPPTPPDGYEAISDGYDRRIEPAAIKAAGGERKARDDGYVLAYVKGEWRRAAIRRRNHRSVDVDYLGADGNTWTGGTQRVTPERVAVRAGGN